MLSTKFIGTGVAIITPFKVDYSIDYSALERVVDYCIKGKVNYIVVLGTTGEPATLNKNEKLEVINTIKRKVAKRVPIVVGIGGNNTQEVVDEIKQLDISDVDAILSVAPYYNKPNQKGIYEHFKAVAKASQLPVMLYNVPHRTGINISSETTAKLANDFDNIFAIKEASGNLTQISEIIRDTPEKFLVISGDDLMTLPMIALGSVGGISVIANALPLEYSQLVNEALLGNFKLAAKIQLMEFLRKEVQPELNPYCTLKVL